MRFVSDSQRRAVFFRLRNSFSNIPHVDIPPEDTYTFKERRKDVKDLTIEDLGKSLNHERILNVVPIEETHLKTTKMFKGDDRRNYMEVAVLSVYDDQDPVVGPIYTVREGKFIAGKGFVPIKGRKEIVTRHADEAYAKINELDKYPKENKKKDPTMSDWVGEYEGDENEFSLYLDLDKKDNEYYVKSDEYPEVKFLLQGFGKKHEDILDVLDDIPDEDFIGLKRIDAYTPGQFRKHYPGHSETSRYVFTSNQPEWMPAIVLNTKGGKKQTTHDVMHEIGHHIDTCGESPIGKSPLMNDPLMANIIADMPADSYARLLNPSDNLGRHSDWADERAEELRGLSGAKGLTFDEAKRYAGEE